MRRLLLELKIAGINFPLVTAALSLALVLFAALAGELLDFAPIAGGRRLIDGFYFLCIGIFIFILFLEY